MGYYTDPTGYAEAGMSDSFVADFVKNPAYAKDIRVSEAMIAEEDDGTGKNKAYYTQKYPGRDGQIYVNNAKVFRLSEVYLIAAEAALKTNNRILYTEISGTRRSDLCEQCKGIPFV